MQNIKRLIPTRLRIWRARAMEWVFRPRAYYERREREDFLRRAFTALDFNEIDGDYVEFGCCGCVTFSLAGRYASPERRLWAFDSFEGLPAPEDSQDWHPKWIAGDMSIAEHEFHEICRATGVSRARYEAVKGFYSETLSDTSLDRADRPTRIALAYVDCDLYSSTRDVLAFLEPRLRHGAIIAFDDYFCPASDAPSGESRAFAELRQRRPDLRFTRYLTFGWHGLSFMVEDGRLAGADDDAGA